MRAQLESPGKSGRTPFRPNAEQRGNDAGDSDVGDGDVLMEDVFVEEGGEEADNNEQRNTLAEVGIHTSEELIRHLKARVDIDENRTTKIAVAKAAYEDGVLQIPKKLFLLTDWLLTTLAKSAKDVEAKIERKEGSKFGVASSVDVEEITAFDYHYWHLLHRCARHLEDNDKLQLANRHSLPHILLGFHLSYDHNNVFETGKGWMNVTDLFIHFHKVRHAQKATDMDTLNRCLGVCLSAVVSDEGKVYQNGAWLKMHDFSLLLGLTVRLWIGEIRWGSNADKARRFFLSDLLPLYAVVLQTVSTAPSLDLGELIMNRLRSISKKIIQTQNGTDQARGELLDGVKKAGSIAYGLLSVFLSQLCDQGQQERRANAGSANATPASTQADYDLRWRQEIHKSFLSPAFEMLCSGEPQFNSTRDLEDILKTCEIHKLYYNVEDDDSWTRSLKMIAGYNATLLKSKRQDFYDSVPSQSIGLMCRILRLDEGTLDDDMRKEAVACAITGRARAATTSDSNKKELLIMLFSSATKQRKVPEIIRLCLDAYGTLCDLSDEDGHRGNDIMFESIFSDAEFCRKTIGVAVADFLYPQQVEDLFGMLLSRLGEHCLSTSTPLKRPRKSKGSSKGPADSQLVLAVVEAQVASRVLRRIAIPEPVQAAVQEQIKALQSRVVMPCLQSNLHSSLTRLSGILAASILSMFESMQALCRSHALDDVKGEKLSWTTLASHLDQSFAVDLHSRLVQALSDERACSALLRAQVFQTVMQAIKRSLLVGKDSSFSHLMQSVDHFRTLTQGGISSFLPHGDFLHQGKKNARWVELQDRRQEIFSTWSRVGTEYLPMLERLASDELLKRMASVATELVLSEVSDGAQMGHTQSSILHNAANLELRRWRKALCQHFGESLLQPFDAVWTTASRDDLVSVICHFPMEWFPSDFLHLSWPALVSSLCASQSARHFVASSNFLARCVNLRSGEIQISLETLRGNIVDILTCEQAGVPEQGEQVRILFTSLISINQQGTPTTEYTEHLCQLFLAVHKHPSSMHHNPEILEDNQAMWAETYHSKGQRYALLMDAASIVLEKLAEVVGHTASSSSGKISGSIQDQLQSNLTRLQGQIALIDGQVPLSETKSAYEPLASLLGLQLSALRLLDKIGQSKGSGGYEALLTGSMIVYDICGGIRDKKVLEKALSRVASSVLQAGRAGCHLKMLISGPSTDRKPGLGCELFDHVPETVIFGSCLGLISVMCCTWMDLGDGQYTNRKRSGHSIVPVLAEASRSASVKEYEGSLDLLLSASCKSRAMVHAAEQEHEMGREMREEVGESPTESEDEVQDTGAHVRNVACALLPTFSILFCNSPENTLAVSQRSFRRLTACMTVWVKEEQISRSAKSLEGQTNVYVLEMVRAVLASRPILFRSNDVSWFLAIASSLISSSTLLRRRRPDDNDSAIASASPSTAIVLVLTNLIEIIRLRRDYVALYLPQLTLLLKQLLPVFYNPINCIYNGEARLFNRLLSAITTKSASSAGTSGLPAGKVKSLAKPFSTHAAHVLVTYVRARTSPSELRSSEEKKTDSNRASKMAKVSHEDARRVKRVEEQEEKEEIKRAMYNLCDIMGPHQKNVMMDMLQDEGEKIVMRSLWRSWEGQRYRGA